MFFFFFSSRRRHTRLQGDWSSDVCSSDLDDQDCGQVTYGQPADRKQGQGIGRVDYQLSQTHSIFGRYMATFDKSPAPYAQTGSILTLAGAGSINNLAQSATGGM